jgi:hypothetical protein
MPSLNRYLLSIVADGNAMMASRVVNPAQPAVPPGQNAYIVFALPARPAP